MQSADSQKDRLAHIFHISNAVICPEGFTSVPYKSLVYQENMRGLAFIAKLGYKEGIGLNPSNAGEYILAWNQQPSSYMYLKFKIRSNDV